ncbi:ABC transporter permease [Streptosporangium sp. NPDC000239]|uniref:ABC transporter permease n=1 Tax=unclassified Streptosporangium TaxID=2632669 RepID=UPI003323C0AB
MSSVPLPPSARLSAAVVLRVSLVGLRGRPLRAALSALGIAIGVAAMVAVLGVGAASRQQLLDQIRTLGTDMLTVHPGQSLFGENARLPVESVGMVARVPSVRSVTAVGAVENGTVRRTDKIPEADTGGIAVAATRLNLLTTLGGSVRSGVFLNSATEMYPATVLGSVAAGRLGVGQPGAQVYLAGHWFTVIGVLDSLPLNPEIDRSALVGWPVAEGLLGFDGHPTTLYERSDEEAVTAVREVLASAVNPRDPEEVQVSRPSDALTAQLAAASTFNSLFLGLGAVALLVGGVGVANTMVISVLERRQEIGLRRALGANRGQIRLQFLAESVVLSLLGGLSGVLLGVLVTLGYAASRGWPLVLPVQALAGGVVASTLIGAVAGLYPARGAARLTPTQALATG